MVKTFGTLHHFSRRPPIVDTLQGHGDRPGVVAVGTTSPRLAQVQVDQAILVNGLV